MDASGPVLHDVPATVAAGSLTALVGPSGAGKSTITSLVTRLYDPNGTVRPAAWMSEVARDDLRSAIGVVSQEAHLFHDTIGANLRYAQPEASTAEVMQARGRADHELDRTAPRRTQHRGGRSGFRLSGGEKQRLALADCS